MAYNSFNKCDGATANTGVACTPDLAAPVKPFLTTEGFEYATQTDADTLATVMAGIVAQTVFPLPIIQEMSDNSEEDTKYTSPINSLQRTVRKGKTIHQYAFVYNPALNNRLQALDGSTMRYYYIDNNNNQIGTSPDDVVFKGFECYVNVDKWKDSDGSNPAFTYVTITFVSNVEREEQAAVFEATYNPKSINGVLPATLSEVGTSNATTVTVNVISKDTGVGISGLVVGDFIFLQDSDGLEETITTAVEDAGIAGKYVLSGAAFETGTVNLRDVVTIGTQTYEGTALAITIA